MKIAFDCRMLGSGGIGSYLAALLPFFLKNHECILIGNRNNILNYIQNQKAEIIDCDIKTFSLKELFNFPKSITTVINTCDLYYSPYCNIPSGIKVPVYTTIHDVVFLDVPGLSGKMGTLIRKWFYQHAYNKSKTVFTVSQFSADRIKTHLKTKKTPTIVTYNAIPHWFTNNVDFNTQKDNSILFVGNIKKHKGLATLLCAFENIIQKNKDIKLVIVGNADNFRTGDSEISQKILSFPNNTVEFTGRISDTELKQYYQRAKLLIQPSLYEGFGMPPMEALTLGTNCVISDIPVFKEIYKDFPVVFFKTGDSTDLEQKILTSLNMAKPEITNNPYSFEKTFNIINNTFQGNIK